MWKEQSLKTGKVWLKKVLPNNDSIEFTAGIDCHPLTSLLLSLILSDHLKVLEKSYWQWTKFLTLRICSKIFESGSSWGRKCLQKNLPHFGTSMMMMVRNFDTYILHFTTNELFLTFIVSEFFPFSSKHDIAIGNCNAVTIITIAIYLFPLDTVGNSSNISGMYQNEIWWQS